MKDLIKTALSLFVVFMFVAFAVAAALVLLLGNSAHARTVAVVPHVATLTNERGTCPRGWFVAKRPDFVRGCYRVTDPARAVEIVWADGTRRTYTEMEFEIHAELRP